MKIDFRRGDILCGSDRYCNVRAVVRGGLSCLLYCGNRTLLSGSPPGDPEFNEAEARALVGRMVRHCDSRFGKIIGYIEMQRPGEAWVYGVEVKWARHKAGEGCIREGCTSQDCTRCGCTSEEFLEYFVNGNLALLDGAEARNAAREWDKRETMSDAE